MTFAYPLPWWGLLFVVAACAALAVAAYARTGLTLGRARRGGLIALRGLSLAALVVCLLRPVALMPPAAGDQGVVAVVVDTSRSMGLADAGAGLRIDRAREVARALAADLARGFRVDVLTAGERVAKASLDQLAASDRRSDLASGIAAVRDRYRDAPLAAIVLVSDGGDTGGAASPRDAAAQDVPVFTVGVGPAGIARDREVRGVTVGPSSLDASLVDLTATIVAHGERSVPVRLVQGRRVIDLRDVAVPADGSPVQQVFTVAPDRSAPAVFRVEVPDGDGELTTGNNATDVLVPPPGRQRRVLMIEGLPGFEHSFLKRAWHQDPSVAIDAVVRKGRNDQGQDTYYVQAAPGRTAALTTGFPVSREALFAYDGVVLANLELDALTRDAQSLVADFVGERGGGLLVLGSQALATPPAPGSPLVPVLPLDLADRRGGLVRTAATSGERLRVAPTDEGLRHPVMRLAGSVDDTRRKWMALPALAGAALMGGPRPGASVLAMTAAATGGTVPLVAVQRFGAGRTMIFGGEASWHWKMMMPAGDTSYDAFWRQSLRWLTGEAPDAVSIDAPAAVPPGATVPVTVTARDAGFAPVPGASVTIMLRSAGGTTRDLPPVVDPSGRAVSTWQADEPGVYELAAEARRGDVALGSASRYVLVGGTDPEFADPRLNDAVLRRLSSGTGGEYLPAADAIRIGDRLRASRAATRPREVRDLWDNAGALLLIVGLLSAEWALRRHWGLR